MRVRQPGEIKNQPAEQHAAEDLRRRRERDGFARAQHFLQVNLQPDHEQQQRQADFRNSLDVARVGDELEAARADGEAGDEIREQQRLPRDLRPHRHDPRGDDANGDVSDKSVLHADENLN